MSGPGSVLVLGIGNTLMTDDGAGIWALRTLAEEYGLPEEVRLIDGGVAGLRLLPDITSSDRLIILDAMKGGGPPGTVYRLDFRDLSEKAGPRMSAHDVGMVEVLSVADLLGKRPRTRIVGIQPLETNTVSLELTAPVRAALGAAAAAAVEELRAMGVGGVRKKGAKRVDNKENGDA